MNEAYLIPANIYQYHEIPLLAKGGAWGIIFIVALILTPFLISFFETKESVEFSMEKNTINENNGINFVQQEKSKHCTYYDNKSSLDKENNVVAFNKEDQYNSQEIFPVWTTGYSKFVDNYSENVAKDNKNNMGIDIEENPFIETKKEKQNQFNSSSIVTTMQKKQGKNKTKIKKAKKEKEDVVITYD